MEDSETAAAAVREESKHDRRAKPADDGENEREERDLSAQVKEGHDQNVENRERADDEKRINEITVERPPLQQRRMARDGIAEQKDARSQGNICWERWDLQTEHRRQSRIEAAASGQ